MKLYSNILGKGEPLLILHGFLGMGDNWKTLGSRYAEEGFEVHLIDQRNHGRSPHTADFNYQVLAEDLKEYCEQHQLKDVSVIGHSMGGKTAMHFATDHPEFIENLIVADIAPKYYPPHHQTILNGLTMLSETKLESRGKADELLKEYISEWSIRQFLLKNLYWKEKGKLALRMNLEVLKEKIDEIGQGLEDDKTFEGRTLFIKAEKSGYIKEEDRDLLKKHFPKSHYAVIKDADHWLHAEQPDLFFEITLGFMRNGE